MSACASVHTQLDSMLGCNAEAAYKPKFRLQRHDFGWHPRFNLYLAMGSTNFSLALAADTIGEICAQLLKRPLKFS